MFFSAQSASTLTVENPKMDKSAIKILIVEDNTVFQKILKTLLEKRGFTDIKFANDGQEAVDMYAKLRPQLVLMDIVMPNKDGLIATQEIRALESKEKWSSVFISAVSGDQCEKTRKKAQDAGMDYFIAKPINPAMFDKALEQALSREQPALNDLTNQIAGIDLK